MKRHLLGTTAGMVTTAAVVFLASCGGQPAATPAPAPAKPPATAPAPAPADPAALRAKGQEVYQTTAGCKNCHGADGKGVPNVAPDVRGKSADEIKRALGGDVMSFIRMTDADINAVAAYLKTLQ